MMPGSWETEYKKLEGLAEEIRAALVCSCVEEALEVNGKIHPFCRGAELAARLVEKQMEALLDG